MTQHKVGSRDEWLAARNELLEREQELNQLSNELAEQRRALPWVPVDKSCPGCTGLADHFDGGVVHLNHRDVTFLGISRAPLEKLRAYKQRMGWQFPRVSSYGSDFPYDFGFAFTEEQMAADEFQQMINEPPDWLAELAKQVGTDLQMGLAEGPGWSVFALSDGVVYHTYSRHAPDGDLLAPYYYQLLDQVPKGRGEAFRAVRRDEYEDATA